MMFINRFLLGGALLAAALGPLSAAKADDAGAAFKIDRAPHGMEWLPAEPAQGYELRIQYPDGSVHAELFDPGTVPAWSPGVHGKQALDGTYAWELSPVAPPPLDPSRVRGAAAKNVSITTGDSGYFSVKGGRVVTNAVEKSAASKQVINGDLTVHSSLCVGIDCANTESYGFDTFRLKENNLRIHFEDTSNSSSFPSNDWRIVANDSANGGASYLAIEDSTAGRVPFRVEAGAPANSLHVDSTGNIGMGTNSPSVEMHSRDGDTPTLRLEQDSSSGFQAQSWDVAGNEANFFVRDVTNGSSLAFRIRPGSGTDDALVIDADGSIGMGTASPDSAVHIQRNDGSAAMFVEETNAAAASRELLRLKNNGSPFFIFEDSSLSQSYSFAMGATGHFLISHQQTSGVQMRLEPNGNLTIQGSLTEGSSRAIKDDVVKVDNGTLLGKLEHLPIAEWNYRGDGAGRHIGPMAEDFYALFGLGPDNKHIAPKDLAGVALAAAKALKTENEALKQDARAKSERIEALEARLERLESLLLESR